MNIDYCSSTFTQNSGMNFGMSMICYTRHGLITKSKFIRHRKMCYLVVQLGPKITKYGLLLTPMLAPLHYLVVNACKSSVNLKLLHLWQ